MQTKLTARKVETARPGKYSDGGNLYLIVSRTAPEKMDRVKLLLAPYRSG